MSNLKLTKEECIKHFDNFSLILFNELDKYQLSGMTDKEQDDMWIKLCASCLCFELLIDEHFDNPPKIDGNTSDGYHTFNELYHHRAILFSVICNQNKDIAWKSKQHNDGTMFDGMFIVGVDTPQGQYSYHYDIEPYWDMFNVKELDKAPLWDGHQPKDIDRLLSIETNPPLKFEELKECKWYWDDYCKEYFKIDYINKELQSITLIYGEFDDGISETKYFEENRFFRRQVDE